MENTSVSAKEFAAKQEIVFSIGGRAFKKGKKNGFHILNQHPGIEFWAMNFVAKPGYE